MDKKESCFTVKNDGKKKESDKKETTKKFKAEFWNKEDLKLYPVAESSHTHFYKMPMHEDDFKRVTRNEYLSISESISGSSETYNCVHGPQGKQYTERGLLKRNILKELDPIPVELNWTDECSPAYGWDMAKKLEFLVQDPTVEQQIPRLEAHLRDFAQTSNKGFMVDTLDSLCIVLNYLVDALPKTPSLKVGLELLLSNLDKPIIMRGASDSIKYFNSIQDFIAYLGYLLLRLESDDLFDHVSRGLIWQLSAPNSIRGSSAVQLRYILAAAPPVLCQSIVRKLAISTSHRFPAFLKLVLLLACDTIDNCIEMMKENIIENIFYRFNPYFPNSDLKSYDINPADLQDYLVKLGDSSVNMTTTLSLLLVLGKTTKQFLEDNPNYRVLLPYPDICSQRCFIWAYRYECRAREHRHERNTLTIIISVLLKCFGDRLMTLSAELMPDIMSLSVLSELPPRNDWTCTVNINISQMDVQFKKLLIYLSVDFLKVFPYNKYMIESRNWLTGLMYLLDPGLCRLRQHWSAPLFNEIRKTAMQALVIALPLTSDALVNDFGLIRRLMWYIEWYSERPYEVQTLYWCMRLLQVATASRGNSNRRSAIQELFDTHGIIILIRKILQDVIRSLGQLIIDLCYILMEQKLPPVEKSQSVISLSLRMITSAVVYNQRVTCCVYPYIKWPASINSIARKMLDVVLLALDKHFIISDRWLISLLNLIWEGIIWKQDYREIFISNNGIYKLLDLITMTRPPVQCIALALVCDVARAGDAVGQLVSWRSSLSAANANPNTVNRGVTIAGLMAAIFRDECKRTGVRLDENNVIQDLDNPIMSSDVWKEMNKPDNDQVKSHRTTVCYPAADMAGSRLSKVFALLHMLSQDLEYRVALADEAYNMYKNIKLAPQDETVLVLCSYYLTMKLNEVWTETKIQDPGLVKEDDNILDEFLNAGKGWAKEIKRQQEDVIEKDRKKELEEECSLYAFLGRVRLNIALDALRTVRCVARSADRARITHVLLQDAVRAHHRRSVSSKRIAAPVVRTYATPLDDQNITGQTIKVYSILPKEKFKPLEIISSSSSHTS